MQRKKRPIKLVLENIYFRNGLLLVSVGLLVCFVGIIFYRLLTTDYQISFPDIILISLLILFSSGVVDSLNEISLGDKGFFARFNKVEQDIKIINEIAKHVLTDGERLQLHRLQEEVIVNVQYTPFLLQEMIRLCQHGFVEEINKDATWKMKLKFENAQDSPYNLKEYYKILEEGKQYLAILKKLDKRLKEER